MSTATEPAPQLTEAAKTDESSSPFGRMDASHKLFVYLCAVFVSCLLLGDVIGGKTISWKVGSGADPFTIGPISVGILPFPVTFLLTDVINDFYGRRGARFVTLLGFFMAALAWIILQISTAAPVDQSTYFTQQEFSKIFGGSAQLFVASMIAYLIGQFLDIHVFQFWKALTESKHLWLRATGSTVLSQLVDTVTINVIFWTWTVASDPTSFLGKMDTSGRWTWIGLKIAREYGIKVGVAVFLTPVVYALHTAIVRGLKIAPEAHEARGAEKRKAA
jgi:hypothetical protein